MTGPLVLVVGPSGAGKDTIMAGARAVLGQDPRYLFARRIITRPAEAGGEDYLSVSPEAFDWVEAQKGFALSWRAHGLAYGIPASIRDHLDAGGIVVANASRAIIPEARRRFSRLAIILVTASPAVLARRLAARGRESEADIAERLRRGDALAVEGSDVYVIRNETSVEAAVQQMLDVLGCLGGKARPSDIPVPRDKGDRVPDGRAF